MFGGLNPVSLLATSMLGPVGGIIAQLAQQVVSQLGQQLLQNLGDQMGLPQSAIDMAQGAFAGSLGDIQGSAQNLDEAIAALGQETGASPAQIGDMQRMVQDILQKAGEDAMQTEEAKEAKAGGTKSGGGWLRALARALGEAADKAAANLEEKAKGLDDATPSESAEYSADAQAFGMLMNAINTAIKAIGEALNTVARKQ
ncbi:hypothetical protein OK349_04675 [Sphingomonas sp. BT-65]|uniref:hypothetical protein n=1 Tax=Sphingomonas sp. BT-65 TaxID=2989821 RepID=UPI0022358865|nr:hypothetical protein [Sphingomonas sp. BT-65]MCW4460991.1 hypothetical protein [Sphingomonas sp. BT-65]